MKNKKTFLIIIIFSTLFLSVIFYTGFNPFLITNIKNNFGNDAEFKNEVKNFPEYFVLKNIPKENKRQTPYDCGVFNMNLFLQIVKNTDLEINILKNSVYKIPRLGVFPERIFKSLKSQNISVKIESLKNINDLNKINYLKSKLLHNSPIILLGQKQNFQHYLTVVGFDKNNFYIYDPFLKKGKENFTIDENFDLPGNKTFSQKELLNFWRGGGMFGFYKWILIRK